MPQHQKLNQNKHKYKQKNHSSASVKRIALKKNKFSQKKKMKNSKDLRKSADAQMKQRIERELAERAAKHGGPIRSIKLVEKEWLADNPVECGQPEAEKREIP
ncbi:hypothetical protein LOD99_7556 [Oopsacas minuta]|uniref:Uncharacterized protein n=1 Tax=Oopsacas minuta TaxID=111878 RepID=A0AAV7JNK3_9METZ|nr:hypothetical protein LOD99_7556 [Oopsacas minuta]